MSSIEVETGKEMEAYDLKGKLYKFKLRENYVGFYSDKERIWTNGHGEPFKVVGNLDYIDTVGKFPKFLIEHEDVKKTRLVISSKSIILGKFHNPNTPTVFGMGYIGQGNYRGIEYRKELYTWSGMLQRCYSDSYLKKNTTYKDCSVDPRWHNFQNFCEDIVELDGYKEWKENTTPLKYALDKDIKVEGNKIYSKDTCMFVKAKENIIKSNTGVVRHLTGLTYEGVNLTLSKSVIFTNISEFARTYGLNRGCVGAVARGERKQHKGWKIGIVLKVNPD